MNRHLSPVMVSSYLSVILSSDFRVGQRLYIITYGQDQLVSDESSLDKFERNAVSHFNDHISRPVRRIGTSQDLSTADTFCFRTIRLYVIHCHRLPSPRMVYQEFGIDAKQVIEKILVSQRAARNVSHCQYSIFCKSVSDSAPDTPKIGQRCMLPKLTTI